MELRDYLQILRRRWTVVVLITGLLVACASLYLAIAPKRYESTTSLLVSAAGLRTVDDLEQGATFARQAATTYATMIDSATVLGPVANDLRPQRDVDELMSSLTTAVPTDTTLITITATGGRADEAAELANAVAQGSARILPALAPAANGLPLIRLSQTRPALEPTAPVSPDAQRVLALALIVGLCTGIATVIVAHTLDTRIRRVDDLRPVTRLPVLAVLPAVRRRRRATPDDAGGAGDPDGLVGPTGEAFRALRTNLRFLEASQQRSVVVTAVINHGNEARVAVNLARSLAQAGRRVLLVDVDLLDSPVAQILGVDATTGLADVLTGRAELGKVIAATTYPGLSVLPSGTPHLGPSDLLSSPILSGVLRRAEFEYDYVIVHAPALLRSTDAIIVSSAAGGTLVTVAAGHTRVHNLQTALGALANAMVTPLGVVLTGGRPGDAQRENDARQPGPYPPFAPRVAAPSTSPPFGRPAPGAPADPSADGQQTQAIPARRPRPVPPRAAAGARATETAQRPPQHHANGSAVSTTTTEGQI